MRRFARLAGFGVVVGLALIAQGCGGGGTGTTTPSAPTQATLAGVGQHLHNSNVGLVGMSLTTFGQFVPQPRTPAYGGPYYSSALGLYVQYSVSSGAFIAHFYQDQAETEPAGQASYVLNLSTQTLSGTMSVTAGPEAGLSGTYSQTVSSKGTAGTYSFTLPDGTMLSCQFNVVVVNGIPSGTGTQTVTLPSGYSEHSKITYYPTGSFQIAGSDSNGYKSTLNFASNLSGTGTVSGPGPGLPAKLSWTTLALVTVTFSNGSVIDVQP